MHLSDYPRPPADTGWGFHDSAGVDCRPGDAAGYARYLRQELGITWFKLLARGTNKVDLARAFTQQGLEVIVRLYAPRPHPDHIVSENDVRAYVDAGAHYFEWGNEPNLIHEWNRASWDEGARVDKVCQQFLRNAEVIRGAGGIPLLPALSPGGDYPHRDWYRTTFEWLRQHGHLSVLEGAAIAIHNRPLNHPVSYTDDTGCCFLEYEWIDDLVRSYLGRSLPLLATEAGYEPGWDQDRRFPAIDVQRHAAYNVEILRGFRPPSVPPTGGMRWRDCLFCQCMWLVDSFGHRDFAEAAWHNNRQWGGGGNLPAVGAMRDEWKARPFVRQVTPAPPQPPSVPPTGGDVSYYHSPRYGHQIEYIIVHDTEGPASAALAWWKSPDNPYLSSAHVLVKTNGERVRCVPDELAAHHAGGGKWPGIPEGRLDGTSIINLVSLGIELEYPKAPASPAYPEVQLAAAAEQVRAWAQSYGVPREKVLRHADVDPQNRTDPRNLDWRAFLDRVFGPADDRAEMERAMGDYGQGLMIPQVPGHALYDYLTSRGWEHASPEFRFVWAGKTYWAQIGYSQADGKQHIAYCLDGDWGHIREFERAN